MHNSYVDYHFSTKGRPRSVQLVPGETRSPICPCPQHAIFSQTVPFSRLPWPHSKRNTRKEGVLPLKPCLQIYIVICCYNFNGHRELSFNQGHDRIHVYTCVRNVL